MRSVLLATTLVVFPFAALAQPHCPVPEPVSTGIEPTIQLPPAITVGGPPVPLMPRAGAVAHLPADPTSVPAAVWGNPDVAAEPASLASRSAKLDKSVRQPMTPDEIKAIPVLVHIATAGANLFDLGRSHGLRTIYARNGGQVMVFEVTPDAQATVAGLMTDISVEQLRSMGAADVTELPSQHGLRGYFLHNGAHYQMFYASPDSERVIPGVMWDVVGKNLTQDQIASIPGTVPTVTIGGDTPWGANGTSAASIPKLSGPALLAVAQGTAHGSIGNASAPQLWMFIDPQCSFSVRAMQQLEPSIAAGRVRLNVIPLSFLDAEDDGLSTRNALSLVSEPSDHMVIAWKTGRGTGAASPDAGARLNANMKAAASIQLQGTPTFVWQKTDGTVGRLDGVPPDVNALIASMGR
jgi:thiol:disulfide interchange protein DsbG